MSVARARLLLSPERLLEHNAMLAVGTAAAGLLGVALQSYVSHRLGPASYGAVFTILAVAGLVSLPAASLTLAMAWSASGKAAGDPRVVLARMHRRTLVAGLGAGAIAVVASPWIAGFLHVDLPLVLLGAAAIPPSICLPLLLGYMQGMEEFRALAILLGGQAGLKLVAVALLAPGLGDGGVLGGIAISSWVVYGLALAWTLRPSPASGTVELMPVARFMARVLPSTIALAVLFAADLALVRHLFPAAAAGLYAAVAALSRAIFWGASSITTVLFPKSVRADRSGRRGLHLVAVSTAMVVAVGLGGMVILVPIGSWLLGMFAGRSYAAGSAFLGWYVLGMNLLGAASVVVTYHQARGGQAFLLVLLPLTAAEPLLILEFHRTLLQVIQAMDLSMGAILLGLLALTLRSVPVPIAEAGPQLVSGTVTPAGEA